MAGRRVTVMVPSYNYAQYLTACVESAAAQPEADVAIVDNGSTDESPAIGAALADRHPNVRFRRYDTNEGIIASFNRCREEVREDYALLLCADDLLAPGALARAVAQMDAHPSVGLLYGTAVDFTDSVDLQPGDVPGGSGAPVVHAGIAWVERLCRVGQNPIRTPEAMFRSSLFDEVGPYDPACPYTSDLNLWLRLASRADVLYLRGPVQAMFRQHGQNEGKAYPHNSIAELEQRWTAYERFFAWLGNDSRRTQWEAMARHTVAGEARYAASRAYVGQPVEEADALLALADRLDGAGVGERAAWAVRRRLGPRWSRWFPGFYVRPVVHRAQLNRGDHRRGRVGIA